MTWTDAETENKLYSCKKLVTNSAPTEILLSSNSTHWTVKVDCVFLYFFQAATKKGWSCVHPNPYLPEQIVGFQLHTCLKGLTNLYNASLCE